MEPRDAHARAQAVFAGVLANVTNDQLDLPTPCANWSVSSLIAHIARGNQWVADLGGREAIELPEDRRAAHAATSAEAQAVFDADDGLTRTFDLPFGTLPGSVFAMIRAGDVYTHSWDLATAVGAPTDLDAELGEALYAATSPFLGDSLRGEGRPFGPAQPCADDRPMADRMAAFLGREIT
jgi:uncharacterized protein (TIGR03086 family)